MEVQNRRMRQMLEGLGSETEMTSLSRFFQGFKSGYRKQHAINIATQPLPTGRQVKKRTSVIVIFVVVAVLIVVAVVVPAKPEDLARRIGGLASLVPVLAAILAALGRRAHCDWSLPKAKRQVWVSIFIIALSQLVMFAQAPPLSPLALLSLVLEVVGVYTLTRAICRKKDLARAVSPAVAQ
jgi:hypothetical protein